MLKVLVSKYSNRLGILSEILHRNLGTNMGRQFVLDRNTQIK